VCLPRVSANRESGLRNRLKSGDVCVSSGIKYTIIYAMTVLCEEG